MKNINSLKNLSILYIEDEALIRKNMVKMLSYLFNTVFEAENFDEAINLYNNNSINIVLSDINLPGKSGLDLVKKIRENNKTIPIVLLTAYTDTDYLLQAVKLNLVDYLRKPVNFEDLKNTLIKASDQFFEYNSFSIKFEFDISYDLTKKQLFKNGGREDITNKEILLLEYLYINRNRTVPKEEIQNHVWEDSYLATDSAFKSLMNKLRKKIGKNSIENISRVGYQLKCCDD